MGVRALFEFGSTQDDKDSTQVIGGADQGGLGLAGPRLLHQDGRQIESRSASNIEDHVAKMLALAGDDPAKAAAEAKTILDLETKLAEASMTRVERRDPEKTYHKMSRAELRTLTPNWSWDNYFQEIGYTNIDSVDVSAPKFFETMSQQLKDTPLDDWKTYLRWHLVNSARAVAFAAVRGRRLQFQGARAAGHDGTTAALEALRFGHGPPTRRSARTNLRRTSIFRRRPKRARCEMVNQLIAALRDDLQTLSWMGPATRKQALAEACRVHAQDRLPGQVARLFRLPGRSRPLCARIKCAARNSHSSAT